MLNICIICAISQEIRPILKRLSSRAIAPVAGLPAWHCQAFGINITLIESGIGISKAAKAALAAVALGPDMIINAGFCGALSPGIALGDVFLAEKICHYAADSLTCENCPDRELTTLIGGWLHTCVFISAAEIIEKKQICRLIPDPTAVYVLEMESSAIAKVCHANGIRFTTIRSVSDTFDYDPSRIFSQICDHQFEVSMAKVAATLITKPSTLKEFLQLYRSSKIAGETLAETIVLTLERIG